MSNQTPQIQMTIKQVDAAKRYGVSDRTIRRWEKTGLIHGTRVLGVKLYPLDRLDELAGLRSRNANDPTGD